MGHIRLGRLPQSRKWRAVVALLIQGAPVEEVAAAASEAAKGALRHAGDDALFLSIVELLAKLPAEARGPGYHEAMEARGIGLASVPELLAGISGWIDAESWRVGERTDIAEIGRSAMLAALAGEFERSLPALFEPTAAEIRTALGRLSSGERFAGLARSFFAGVTHRVLEYYLSRELANHIGPGRRFATDADRVEFDRALAQHAFEASRIVDAYAGGWYGKAQWQGGGVTADAVRNFTRYSLQKLTRELAQRDHAA